MNHYLLFKIYNQARSINNHSQVVLPNINPEYKIVDIQPIRKHTNFHSFG